MAAALSGGGGAVSPACLVVPGASQQAAQQHRVLVSGPRLLKATPLRVVALQHGHVLVDEFVHAGEQPIGSLRFLIPPDCLEVGIVTIHVLTEQQQALHGGRASSGAAGRAAQELLETSYILALPPDAAEEVLGLFDKMTAEIEHFFGRSGCSAAQSTLLAPLQRGLGWLLQPLSFGSSAAASKQCASCGEGRSSTASVGGACSSCGSSRVSACGTLQQQRQQQRQQPDPVTCYAFEHYFLPFVQHWRGLLGSSGDSGSSIGSSVEADEAKFDQMRRMLDYLMENEMWSCMVLLMGRAPDLWQRALAEGVESPAEHCLIDSLAQLQPAPQRQPQALQQQRQQQQRRHHGIQVGRQQQQLSRAASDSSSLEDGSHDGSAPFGTVAGLQHTPHWSQAMQQPLATRLLPSTQSLSVQQKPQQGESALQQLLPQEYSEGLKPLPPWPEQQPGQQQQQQVRQQQQQQEDLALQQRSWAPEILAPAADMRCNRSCRAGGVDNEQRLQCCATRCAVVGSDCCAPRKQALGSLHPAAATKAPQLGADSAPASGKGKDNMSSQQLHEGSSGASGSYKQLERVYVVYKNHSNFSADATASIVSLGFVLAVISQAANNGQMASVVTLLLYCACFYAPYALLLLWPQAYLRHREALLVASRCASSGVVLAAATGLLPLPTVWRALPGSVLHGVMNGVVLPLCQQLRLWAAAMVVIVQLLCDGLAGAAVGESPAAAARKALCVALCTMLVTFVMDVRARRQFMRACNGQALRAAAA